MFTLRKNPLAEVFSKFRVYYYRDVFKRINNRDLSLTTTEAYCLEIIGSLDEPTINEFASFMGISSPNATYKVNSLIRKGYLTKKQSGSDKREMLLSVTDKYYKYWNISDKYMEIVQDRLEKSLTPEEYAFFTRIMQKISDEMMPEASIPAGEGKKHE